MEKWFHYLRSLQLVVTGNNAEHEDFILSVRDLYEDSHLVRPPPSHKVPKMILTVLHFFTSQERAWRGRWWYSPIQKNLDTSSILPHFIWHLIIQLYILKSSSKKFTKPVWEKHQLLLLECNKWNYTQIYIENNEKNNRLIKTDKNQTNFSKHFKGGTAESQLTLLSGHFYQVSESGRVKK